MSRCDTQMERASSFGGSIGGGTTLVWYSGSCEMTTRFDQSLPTLLSVIEAQTDDATVRQCIFIRDATGRLGVVIGRELDQRTIDRLEKAIRASIGDYARPDTVVRDVNGVGVNALLTESKT